MVYGTNLNTAKLSYYDNTVKLEDKYLNINSGTSSSSSGVDEYRKVIGSDYDIFNSKIAGNLYLIAELEVVDTFTVTWELVTIDKNGYTISFYMDTTSSNGCTLSNVCINSTNNTT